MKTFKVTVIEHSKTIMEVEAEDEQQALEKAEKEYFENSNEYVLDTYDTEFEL